jgi:hypothetical protein
MRFVFTTLFGLALGLLPVGTARADMQASPATAMSCHGHDGDMGGSDQSPGDEMQACAQHCLSQVNGHANFSRLTEPSLQNAIVAEIATDVSSAKPRMREAPDPPPPRG